MAIRKLKKGIGKTDTMRWYGNCSSFCFKNSERGSPQGWCSFTGDGLRPSIYPGLEPESCCLLALDLIHS